MTRDTTPAVRMMYREMLMARPPAARLAASCRMLAAARDPIRHAFITGRGTGRPSLTHASREFPG